ncbi:MAG: phenylacetic acid degradation protein [Chloroflexi bacterium]|nr:phenylacetic acid degradation protein [Chloroflexota bacterium]
MTDTHTRDTQWLRYMVLHQEREDKPHQHAGTVHAPDAEMALLNARDVFVRRPECVSLWVVRADLIFTCTQEELALHPDWIESLQPSGNPVEKYYFFAKLTQKGQFTHIGEVEAQNPTHALKIALQAYPDTHGFAWWVFPVKAVLKSTPDDIAVMFGPAAVKDFRDQANFHALSVLRKLMRKQEVEESHES